MIRYQTGEKAAEEIFDLTNNPSRNEERNQYNIRTSVSVGDIITVDEVSYLCDHIGWKKL